MSRRAWAFVLGGVLAGVLVAAALERVYQSRLGDLAAQIAVVDQHLRERMAVKASVDAYQKDRARFEAQLRAIDEERARQRCPGLLLSDLELERRSAAPVDGLTLDGTTLALVGRAESDADVKALAESVRGAKWVRAVRAGTCSGRRRSRAPLRLPRDGRAAGLSHPAGPCSPAGNPRGSGALDMRAFSHAVVALLGAALPLSLYLYLVRPDRAAAVETAEKQLEARQEELQELGVVASRLR